MTFFGMFRRRFFCAVLMITGTAANADALTDLADTVTRTEAAIGGRVGIAIRHSGTDWGWEYRANERFPLNSTFKALLCAAILDRVDHGTLLLHETIRVNTSDILSFAPATQDRVGEDMRIGELCYGALDKSDNTAANLLIRRLGGTEAVTRYLRDIGDPVSRLDRMEPAMNLYLPGNPQDTTTPAAMISTWETLLLRDALQPGSRQQLADWMRDGWAIADKSGGGRSGSRSIVAMIAPPGNAPVFVAIYIAESPADWSTRNAAISELSAAVVGVLGAQ